MDRPGQSKPEQNDEEAVSVTPLRDWGDDWVHELLEISRPGAEINLFSRGLGDRIVPFEFDDFS